MSYLKWLWVCIEFYICGGVNTDQSKRMKKILKWMALNASVSAIYVGGTIFDIQFCQIVMSGLTWYMAIAGIGALSMIRAGTLDERTAVGPLTNGVVDVTQCALLAAFGWFWLALVKLIETIINVEICYANKTE